MSYVRAWTPLGSIVDVSEEIIEWLTLGSTTWNERDLCLVAGFFRFVNEYLELRKTTSLVLPIRAASHGAQRKPVCMLFYRNASCPILSSSPNEKKPPPTDHLAPVPSLFFGC